MPGCTFFKNSTQQLETMNIEVKRRFYVEIASQIYSIPEYIDTEITRQSR